MSGQALAAPGDLDPSFGIGGVVETRQAILQDHFRETAVGMAIGPQDEIFVLGAVPRQCSGDCPVDLEVTRYNRNGSRDASFGSAGRVLLAIDPATTAREPAAIAATRGGKVVVAAGFGDDVAVFRLASNGNLDPGFAGGGMAVADFGGRDGVAAVAVQPDGRVIVAGTRETPVEGFQSMLVRFTAGGGLDTGFGEGGFRVLGFVPGGYPGGLALPGRNRVAVGLSDCCYSTGRAFVARLGANGVPDPDFARRGWSAVGRLAPASVEAVMPARRGRLVLVGTYKGTRFAARFLADGRSDRHFGRRGVAWPGVASRRSWHGAAVDGRGRVLMVGSGRSSREFALSRLRQDGGLDRTFAGGFAAGFPEAQRTATVGVQSSGRIVVFGEAGACDRTCPAGRLVLARYMGGNSGARCAGRRASVVGTRGKDLLTGTGGRDVIQAFGGADVVVGLGGNDLLCGGPGNDDLRGGEGRDRILGGAGKNIRSQ
jgi:uncharacterized delta-60 repeat protein